MRAMKVLAATVAITASALAPHLAGAQFGIYQLPKDNFVWQWGRSRDAATRTFADLDVRGSEGPFQCQLSARLRAAGSVSRGDVSAMENDLRSRIDFIYAASEAMNYLDRSAALDWATLDCKKPEAAPVDEEERIERESRAREKMQREVERRRARQQRDETE